MNIESNIEFKSYIDIDITDTRFDDTDDKIVKLTAIFDVKPNKLGLSVDLFNTKNIVVSYTGIKLTDDEDDKEPVEVVIDDTWTVENKTENNGMVLTDIIINVDTKTIIIEFYG